jgi:hypothetical protein
MHIRFLNTYTAVILRQLYDDIIVLHPDIHNSHSHQTQTHFLSHNSYQCLYMATLLVTNKSVNHLCWTYVNSSFLYFSNKSTNQMQQFLKFITWHLSTSHLVLGVLIRSSTTAVAACGFTVGAWWLHCCWSWSGRPAGLTTTNSTATTTL